jgi:hypothetical protein
LILSTSVIGAELFIRSIGTIIGGYPNVLEMIDKLNQGIKIEYQMTHVIYFIIVGIVAAAGMWYQYKTKVADYLAANPADYLKGDKVELKETLKKSKK